MAEPFDVPFGGYYTLGHERPGREPTGQTALVVCSWMDKASIVTAQGQNVTIPVRSRFRIA